MRLAGSVLVFFFGVVPAAGATIPPEFEKNITVTTNQDEDILPSLVSRDGLVFTVRLGESSREYTFFLDTGAEMCVLDNEIAKELALPQLSEVESRDSSGNVEKVRVYKTESLSLGKTTVHNLPILGLDMKFLQTTYDVPINGMIGYNFLKHFAVTLDYQHNQVVLSVKSPLTPEKGVLFATVNENDFAVTIPVTIDGAPINLYIDTGAMSGAINIPNELVEKCKVKRYSNGSIIEGAFGYSARNILAGAHVMIGDYNFNNALIYSSEVPVLGHEFLSQFKVVLDYPGQKAWLIPNGQIVLREDEYGTGLGLERDEKGFLVVSGIWEGSPADLAQLHVGDRISVINGMKTSDQTDVYWRRIMQDSAIPRLKLVIENTEGVHRVVLEKANLLLPYGERHLKTEGVFITVES